MYKEAMMELRDEDLSPEHHQVALLRMQAHVEQLLAAGTRLRAYMEQLQRDSEQMKSVAEQVYHAARQAADDAERRDDVPPIELERGA
jgi:multidrug resistance efflux pump